MPERPVAVRAAEALERCRPGRCYPADLTARIGAREKRPLGEMFGPKNFGVNPTRPPSGAASPLRRAHARQDGFVYVLEGRPVLVADAGETPLATGMCAGFAADSGDARHLGNRGPGGAVYLEVGDRTPGDSVFYPEADLKVEPGPDGQARYQRKDGTSISENP